MFVAMKAVEVYVREVTKPDNDPLVGVRLMRAAFAIESGGLTDMSVDAGERQARMDLFARGIGSYKNPHSHRKAELADPADAAEIILLANHLLRIVDGRLLAMMLS